MRIAHLSDPHFGTVREGLEDALRTAIFNFNPDLVLITGDITQRARASQFAAAKRFLDSLAPLEVIAVPGNHDIPLLNLPIRILHPYRGFRRLFVKKTSSSVIKDKVKVFVLNSTDRWRHIQGELRIDRLKKIVDDQNEDVVVRIAAFHHPMDCPKEKDQKNLLKNGEAALQVFDRAGIDLIVGGHIHDPLVTLSTKRYPQIKRALVIAVAGTCLSWRTRSDSDNSFNQIEIDLSQNSPEIAISRADLGKDFQFHVVDTKRFVRARNNNWNLKADESTS